MIRPGDEINKTNLFFPETFFIFIMYWQKIGNNKSNHTWFQSYKQKKKKKNDFSQKLQRAISYLVAIYTKIIYYSNG